MAEENSSNSNALIDKGRIINTVISSIIMLCILSIFNLYRTVTVLEQRLTTAEEEIITLKQIKADKEMQNELKGQIKTINEKLDKIIDKL